MSLTAERLTATTVAIRGGAELRQWYNEHIFKVPGYQYMPRFKKGFWDGNYYPGQFIREIPGQPGRWEFVCSRGLLPRFREFRLQTFPDKPLSTQLLAATKEATATPGLRDYQIDAIERIVGLRWGRVAFATNAGKGAIIGLLARIFSSDDKKVLILCDEIEVFRALSDEIAKWATGVVVGKVESGIKEIPKESVIIAMVPTLQRRLDSLKWQAWLERFDVVLADEADKATAPTWRAILKACSGSEWRAGFSGTFPTDPYGSLIMDELLGPPLTRVANIDLVERGISARPTVTLYPYPCPARIPAFEQHRDWWKMTPAERRRWVYEQAIVYNQERHAFIRDMISPGVPTCIIVNRVDHGTQLADVIPDSRYLDGSASKALRNETLDAFARGEFQVLIVTKILDRGSNRLGHTLELIFASGEGSNRQTLQRIGRGLRKVEGKEYLNLRDIADSGQKFLNKATARRIQLYHSEQFEVHVHR